MKKLFFKITGIVLLVILSGIVYFSSVIYMAGNDLPPTDGEISFPELTSEVVIRRDGHGIPHIEASNLADLYFAQGFAHAQDRFWQMAVNRQTILGRLSEWYGSMTINLDRRHRVWGWQELAEKAYQNLNTEEQKLINAYADGVNAWLESDAYRRPPEMRILHIEPEPWQPSDSFIVNYSIHSFLAGAGSEPEHTRQKFLKTSKHVLDILDRSLQVTPPIIPSKDGDTVNQPTALSKDKAFSNNWTLSGAHTRSGLPLMASDPQLPIALPNVWQVQALNLDGRLIAGASFPGVPGIVVGHNSSVAWGITNGQVDVQDYAYIEQHPEDETLYRHGPDSDWLTYLEHTEEIVVRFGDTIKDRVRKTTRGMVSPMNFPNSLVGDMENTHVEFRDVATDMPGTGPATFIKLNQANTVSEAIDAISGITSIALSFSLADTSGNIGYVVSGRIPIRDKQHATTIDFYPLDDINWELAPFEVNPKVINPASGRIVSANQQITDDTFPFYLSDVWASPHRTKRIHEMLDQKTLHDVESFHGMQSDTLSPVARELTPMILNVQPEHEADKALVKILSEWDYHFKLDSPAPIIWATWTHLLNEKVLNDDLSTTRIIGYGIGYLPLKRALSGERSEWCDDITTDGTEDCAEVLSSTLTQTRLTLEKSFGLEPRAWLWGDVAQLQFTHSGLGLMPIIGGQFNRSSPLPGGPESLFVNELTLREAPTFRTSQFNSSFQAIYDLSDLDNSLYMFSGGSSGHYKSANYDDMTSRWIAGERIKLQKKLSEPYSEFRLSPQN